jgi:hypothetical protein
MHKYSSILNGLAELSSRKTLVLVRLEEILSHEGHNGTGRKKKARNTQAFGMLMSFAVR